MVPPPGPLLGEHLAARAGRGDRVTHALIPPAALATVDSAAASTCPTFRTVVVGGEACPADLVAALGARPAR